MKNKFKGYFPSSSDEQSELWQSAIFSYDTSVLLNLYRYSPSTRDSLLQVLRATADRTVLTTQVCEEFFRNRIPVISSQTAKYEDAIKDSGRFLEDLDKPREHPFVDPAVLDKTREQIDVLIKSLEKELKAFSAVLADDHILREIGAIYSDRINNRSEDMHKEYLASASSRLQNGVPPGTCDKNKDSENKRSGDAIMWLELLDICKSKGKSLIFITDDQKSDWITSVRGKKIGPNLTLIQEFWMTTQQAAHIYTPTNFLNYASKHFNLNIDDATIQEAKTLSRNRARKRDDASGTRRGPRKTQLVSQARHASKHLDQINGLVDAIGGIPRFHWSDHDSLVLYNTEELNEGRVVTSRCPCLYDLTKRSHSFSRGSLFHIIDEAEDSEIRDGAIALSKLRKLSRGCLPYLKHWAIKSDLDLMDDTKEDSDDIEA